MLTIAELEARALRRADAVDDLERRIAASRWGVRVGQPAGAVERGGLWSRMTGWMKGDGSVAEIARFQAEKGHADAGLRIAVDELFSAHCAALAATPWGQALLVPVETALLTTNDAYLPWDRALRFAKEAVKALRELHGETATLQDFAVDLVTPMFLNAEERAEKVRLVQASVHGFVESVDLLARLRPETELPLLRSSLSQDDIIAAMEMIAVQCQSERAAVEIAQANLETANQLIATKAWSKIPARLRPER